MGANERQEGGSHYKDRAIQPWDAILAWELGFLDGSVVKYVSRWRKKGGVEDLKKARHFLDKLIEVSTKTETDQSEPEPTNREVHGACDLCKQT